MLKPGGIIFVFLLILSGCYKETEDQTPVWDVFDISLSEDTRQFLYSSKDTSYQITDPDLALRLNDRKIYVKKMSIRGRSSLDYPRKSFSLRLDFPVYMSDWQRKSITSLTSVKLISLCMDYTYINNRLAFGLQQHAGIMPLFYKYVEVKINGECQGIYLLLEDPEEHTRQLGSEFIMRRDYHHAIRDSEYNYGGSSNTEEEYVQRFKEIYAALPDKHGKELYEWLDARINMTQYFRKMTIDYLLQNGDYTDEVYLYAIEEGGGVRFNVIPWDYDDIFSSLPHEVGRDWAVGKLLGERTYQSHADVFAEIGDGMVFSIEDDLDYVIALDTFIYSKYEKEMATWLKEIDARYIQNLFTEVYKELGPFYQNTDIIMQSQLDRESTSRDIWLGNMAEKEDMLLQRLSMMKERMNIGIE